LQVIRVPIASFNPTSMDNSAASTVLSKKLCKLDNGPTFSYAETGLGSGGQVSYPKNNCSSEIVSIPLTRE
jgi:hypothetical protein